LESSLEKETNEVLKEKGEEVRENYVKRRFVEGDLSRSSVC